MKKLIVSCLMLLIGTATALADNTAPLKDKDGWVLLARKPALSSTEFPYGIYINVNHIERKSGKTGMLAGKMTFDKPSKVNGAANVKNILSVYLVNCDKHTISVGYIDYLDTKGTMVKSVSLATQFFAIPPKTLFVPIEKYACNPNNAPAPPLL